MANRTVVIMSKSEGLKDRLVGCAATEGRADAKIWVDQNIWSLIAKTDWIAAYESAESSKTVNVNPDTGARDDVITDGMILASVQALMAQA